ncbi:hypothetical protein TURU_019436 [Turdus rufiventris]|nr:hypothetical protein TURU_019436 [Turdus rufiventris]
MEGEARLPLCLASFLFRRLPGGLSAALPTLDFCGGPRRAQWLLPTHVAFRPECIILIVITQHLEDSHEIRPSQQGFRNGWCYLVNPISFHDQLTCLMDDEKAVDIVYLNFSKAFNIIAHSIFL